MLPEPSGRQAVEAVSVRILLDNLHTIHPDLVRFGIRVSALGEILPWHWRSWLLPSQVPDGRGGVGNVLEGPTARRKR